MKKFLRHWQYGIKARVVDGALVANITTALNPVFVRLELSRLQAVTLDIISRDAQHELVLVAVGAPGAVTSLAKFDVRDAADEAAAAIRCALFCGTRTNRFKNALVSTFGIGAALVIVLLVLAGINSLYSAGPSSAEQQMQSMLGSLNSPAVGGAGALTAPPALPEPGEPMSADQFLQAR